MTEPALAGGETAADPHGRLRQVRSAAAAGFRRYLISSAYIFVMLSSFTLHEEIALRTHDGVTQALPYAPHGFAIINALVLGKVALVVEELRLGQRWRPKPLIIPIFVEAVILALLFVAMHVIEGLIGGAIHGQALAKSVPAIAGGGAVGVCFATFGFFVAMVPFCAFRQITEAIGWPRMRALLFDTAPEGTTDASRS